MKVCEDPRAEENVFNGLELEGREKERRQGGTFITPSSAPVASMFGRRAMTRLIAALQNFGRLLR